MATSKPFEHLHKCAKCQSIYECQLDPIEHEDTEPLCSHCMQDLGLEERDPSRDFDSHNQHGILIEEHRTTTLNSRLKLADMRACDGTVVIYDHETGRTVLRSGTVEGHTAIINAWAGILIAQLVTRNEQ